MRAHHVFLKQIPRDPIDPSVSPNIAPQYDRPWQFRGVTIGGEDGRAG